MFFGIFNIVPNLLTTGLTTLFPIFASYKALRTGDPQQLTPWLMFWVCFTIAQTAEYWFAWAVDWVPFYAWMRFGAYLYLVQGAPYLYQTHVHPFLSQHEHEIERFISDAHENGKRIGLEYLNQAIEFVKVNVLGMQPTQPAPPQSRAGQGATYAQNLLSRFNLPSATQGLAAPAGDFYGLVSGALQGAAQWQKQGSSRDDAAAALSASGTLIPEEIARGRPEDRANYIANQRDRLQTLINAFDREAANNNNPSRDPSRERRGDGLTKSKSELEFDRVEYDEALEGPGGPARQGSRRTTSGGWMPWQWGAGGQQQEGRLSPQPPSRSRTPSREDRGRATSNDLAY
ncbi:TB2/DP1/HVA22-related protein [Neofusicoccum parvum]|uniref:TB2/DP1/HVA22-related protein n=1 Tax=Neofusicoccum parvum TaxID=310453 RepID=A0ACB5RSI7_9PEZI|nr:TB2/DP1/HVA22-related protein [Neofusicoccum parvum]